MSSAKVPADVVLLDTDWKPFPTSKIPENFNSGNIYHYLIESVQFVSGASGKADTIFEDLHTAKPLKRGKQYYQSGNVSSMQYSIQQSNYCVKAQVAHSMTAGQYNVRVVLSLQSGFVKNATCECRASAMGDVAMWQLFYMPFWTIWTLITLLALHVRANHACGTRAKGS